MITREPSARRPYEILDWRLVFAALRRKIERALKHGGDTYSFDSLKRAVELGRFKLFYLNGAVLLVELINYPNYCTAHFFLAAGDLEQCLLLEGRGCEWARECGCKYATIAGREGWVRTLSKRAWKREPTVLLSKEL